MLRKEADDTLDQLVRRTAHVEIPAEVEDRLRDRLKEFRAKVERRPPARFSALAHSLVLRRPLRMAAMAVILLAAVGVGLVLAPGTSRSSRLFAAAAAQLRSAQSLEYTVVLNAIPYVAVDLSYLAPGYRRVNCSWGIEVRIDDGAGKQLVLMHGARKYLLESGRQAESQPGGEDFLEQLRSLPEKADEVLGGQQVDGRRLLGYRLRSAPPGGASSNLQAFDVWIDAATSQPDHVDITVQEPGKPPHQMYIRNIRVGAQLDRSAFDLTPPAGYTSLMNLGVQQNGASPGVPEPVSVIPVQIGPGSAMTAVVLPMHGEYSQTASALLAVQSYLERAHVQAQGPPFGRFPSEQGWDAGYPVPPGTTAGEPLKVISVPAGVFASAVVNGAWGENSTARWGEFLQSVIEQGYVPAGPPMEFWSGDESRPESRSTEMRMAVTKGNGS